MSALESLMPPVAFAPTGGGLLAYYEAGPRTGVPVIFCHGFPELAFSWRHQLKACAEAGRWAVAPDQRGYGLTPGPAAVEGYDIEALTGDLVSLLDHLQVEKAVFCGHDWGGIVVWQMALRHPDRVAGVIGVNTPFVRRPPDDPVAILRRRFGEDMYIVAFQRPAEADAVLAADVAKTMAYFLRRPEANAPRAGAGLAGGGAKGDAPRETFALLKRIEAWDAGANTREPFLTDAEMAVFVETFSRTGFTGAINWYRNFTRNWARSAHLVDRVEAPSLMITAELDEVLPPSVSIGMEAFVPNLDRALIQGSGHWTQQEKPDEVNAVILPWLAHHFPAVRVISE